MVKVLHVLSAVNGGGIESMLLTYYKRMDRDKVAFDLVAHKEHGTLLAKEFERLGSKIFYITGQRVSLKQNRKELKELLKNNQYDVIHFHHGILSLGVGIAKKYNPKAKIVVHSHSTYEPSKIVRLLKPLIKFYILRKADCYCACGIKAGEYLFGEKLVKSKKVYIINNAINTDKFKFSTEYRDAIRTKFQIQENELVVGVVARMNFSKNPEFIIELAKGLKIKGVKFKLLWVGDGELKQSIEEQVASNNLQDYVYFAGACKNANEFYSAFDVFILPSRYEGLGISAIESQQNGCPTLLSDKVPMEANISSNCETLPLDVERWVNMICSVNDTLKRQDNSKEIIEHGFDIDVESKKLTDFYINL